MRKGLFPKTAVIATMFLMAFSGISQAFDAAENDGFYLGIGTSNISVASGETLLSGSNIIGGARIGLISILFVEVGYGTVTYSDTVAIAGVQKEIDFRTTGPHVGLGFIIPIREQRIGLKFHRSIGNKWVEKITDVSSTATDSNLAGYIDFESSFLFTQLQKGKWEIGMRQDTVRNTNSIFEQSMGVYFLIKF